MALENQTQTNAPASGVALQDEAMGIILGFAIFIKGAVKIDTPACRAGLVKPV